MQLLQDDEAKPLPAACKGISKAIKNMKVEKAEKEKKKFRLVGKQKVDESTTQGNTAKVGGKKKGLGEKQKQKKQGKVKKPKSAKKNNEEVELIT